VESELSGATIDERPIAFVLPNMGGGGAERVALYLIRRLVELNYPVDLVLMQRRGELLEMVPPQVRIVDLNAPRIRNALRPLMRYFKREQPRSAQVRLWPLTVIAILAKLLARAPTRLIVSDHAHLSVQHGKVAGKLLGVKWSVRLFYPIADARVVVSRGAADDLARLSGINRERFEVIYNPVERVEIAQLSPAKVSWGGDGARIISVGTLKAQKNHKLLIRSFARLRERIAAKLMIVGEGALRSELQEEAERLGIKEDVLLPGFTHDVADLLASADLFVLSSDYEGFGNVLIEAMRCGVPVVTTDCPSGPAEIVADGKYGRLVPCGDEVALAEAMEASLREHPSPEILRERADEISGEAPVKRYIELLTSNGSA
jgi:glycosyltransferase involved in cell wall biosynthesis